MSRAWTRMPVPPQRPPRPLGEDVDNEPIPDPLDEKFKELERKVRQRDCPHDDVVEVTTFGGRSRYICKNCSAPREEKP